MDESQPGTLIGRVREAIRYKHCSIRNERSYVEWVGRFVRFHGMRHPGEMGAPEVRAYLGYLSGELKVSASTHHQALAALLFLYGQVLGGTLPWLGELERPKKPKRMPVVLGHHEGERLPSVPEGTNALMARLLYGTGMRLMECVRLRVKDADFERGETRVRDGKGGKDRGTVLPATLVPELQAHLARVHGLWVRDREAGQPGGALPEALARRYPSAPRGGMVLGVPGTRVVG